MKVELPCPIAHQLILVAILIINLAITSYVLTENIRYYPGWVSVVSIVIGLIIVGRSIRRILK